MSVLHNELLIRASELKRDGIIELTFPTKQKAHAEYMNLKRALKNLLDAYPSLRSLDILRKENNIILEMGISYEDFPKPVMYESREAMMKALNLLNKPQ